jgi:hypothetical protein
VLDRTVAWEFVVESALKLRRILEDECLDGWPRGSSRTFEEKLACRRSANALPSISVSQNSNLLPSRHELCGLSASW